MKHWQQYDLNDRLDLLDITSAAKGLPRLAIEKDWWVMMTLKALSQTRYAGLMSFKGGTSLSKGWGLIDRFSEDIDIALRREDRFSIAGVSNTQLSKARRTARHYVIRELPDELTAILSGIGVGDFSVEPETHKDKDGELVELRATTHPSVVFVRYKSIVPEDSEYIQPHVKIEVSSLSMDEPVESKEMRPFISETVPEAEDVSVTFNTVLPTRTLLEKIMLLHEEFQKENPRTNRMSRHLYDISRIMDTSFGEDAIRDHELYGEIVKHRSIFNRLDYVDYFTHDRRTVNFIPPQHLIEDYREDYNAMLCNFMYSQSGHSNFEELIEKLVQLKERLASE